MSGFPLPVQSPRLPFLDQLSSNKGSEFDLTGIVQHDQHMDLDSGLGIRSSVFQGIGSFLLSKEQFTREEERITLVVLFSGVT